MAETPPIALPATFVFESFAFMNAWSSFFDIFARPAYPNMIPDPGLSCAAGYFPLLLWAGVAATSLFIRMLEKLLSASSINPYGSISRLSIVSDILEVSSVETL